jgi:hypothetical protein
MPAGTYPMPPVYTGSKVQSSQGTSVWVNTSATTTPTWVFIGESLGVKFSDKAMFDDSSNLQSQAKEFLSVLADPGKCVIGLNRVANDPGQIVLQASKVSGTRLPYSVVFPINTLAGQTTAGDQRNFLAYVESLSPDIEKNKAITNNFTLQISGAITEVPGS